jgi:hypothetical protein
MKNVLFYGNCQLGKIMDIMCLPPAYFNVTYIPCFTTSLSDLEFDYILKQSDIIITQPIHDNYRDKYYLASNYVVNKCKEHSVILFINNCHFDFYYFDLIYSKSNKYLHTNIIDCINNNKDVNYCKKTYIENINLKSNNELLEIFNKTISELNNRYQNMLQYRKHNTHFINIVPFIEKNYKNKLLFYTFNHPTKHLLQFIALEIIKILNIPDKINYDLDPFIDERGILYSCIQKMVHFNIRECTPFMNGYSGINDIFNATKKEV